MADSNGCQVRGHVGENQEFAFLPDTCTLRCGLSRGTSISNAIAFMASRPTTNLLRITYFTAFSISFCLSNFTSLHRVYLNLRPAMLLSHTHRMLSFITFIEATLFAVSVYPLISKKKNLKCFLDLCVVWVSEDR